MSQDEVILVNDADAEIGRMEKLQAHQQGLLHRAFSVLLYNAKGQLLLQKRALGKYHSPGLWTNTCCSHPKPGETIEQAVTRRLQEELAITCSVVFNHKFIYRVEFDNGLIEHEMDYVFTGLYEELGTPNPEEVLETKWFNPEEIKIAMALEPENYTIWFRLIMDRLH